MTTTDTRSQPYADVGEHFARDTADHEMTVLLDDGLYRHIRFQKPGTSFYHFNLVTWPGYLAITGDMDGFVFRRSQDMFEFFRLHGSGINPGYWAEKLVAPSPDAAKAYDEDRARQLVTEYIAEHADEFPGLAAAVQAELFDADEWVYEDGARALLDKFEHPPVDYAAKPEIEAVRPRFRFHDVWEWDLRDYTHHFLWACHAIKWGISQYDARHQLNQGE